MALVLPHSRVALCHCLSRLGSLHYLVSRELPSGSGLRMFEFIGCSGCKLWPLIKSVFQTCAVPLVTSADPNQGPEPQFTCSPSNFDVMAWRSQLSSQQPWFQVRDTGMLHPQSPRQSFAQQPATASHAHDWINLYPPNPMQNILKQLETHASSFIPAFQAQNSAMGGCAVTAHGV